MKKIVCFLVAVLFAFNVWANTIDGKQLNLTDEQNQKVLELKEKFKAEVEPIIEEMKAGKERVVEIEKKYFEEFWNLLTDEQKEKFATLNK